LPYANKADVSQNFRRASQIKEGESVPGDFARRPRPKILRNSNATPWFLLEHADQTSCPMDAAAKPKLGACVVISCFLSCRAPCRCRVFT